jgi:hypothetical protein
MKIKILPLLVVLVLGFGTSAFAQFAAHSPFSTNREFGFYDRSTGAFLPLKSAAAQDSEAAATATTVTGSLVFKFTVTTKSAVPKNGVITCATDLSISDTSGFTAEEHATGTGTLVSANTYDCTATVNYSWSLSSASTDKIYYTPSATIGYGYEITATNGAATLVVPATERSTTRGETPIAVPGNGATTTEDITLTL